MNPALRDILESTSFSPADLSGLALWLDASDAGSLTLDGSNNVSQWNDKSGNARHVTQATTLNRPGFTPGDGVTFTGAAHQLTNATSLLWTGGNSMFVAFRCTETASYATVAGDDIFLFMGSWGLFTGPNVNWGRYALFYTGATTSAYAGLSQIATTDRVFRALTTGTTSAIARVIGATTQDSTPKTAGTPSVANNIRVGAFPRGNMVVRECLAYDRLLSDAESSQVEAYLMAKWGA